MVTKEELTIDLMKQAMAGAQGLDNVSEKELRGMVQELVRVLLTVSDEAIKNIYGEDK